MLAAFLPPVSLVIENFVVGAWMVLASVVDSVVVQCLLKCKQLTIISNSTANGILNCKKNVPRK